ncbi:MAG TPA: patatin-like phospholipase family protein [Ktedonobacterales bacterium]|nr:patatin-like phospholipase family protein [Ktedonobacterales bacterium]
MQIRTLAGRVSGWFARSHVMNESLQVDEPLAAPKTAFVLLGGGARGAAQAGALTVLLEAGLRPDIIIGISAGSWNGSYLAMDPTPERAAILEGLWIATTSQEILGPRRWIMAVNAVANRASLYGSAGMRRMAERQLQGRTFADVTVPLHIVATDLATGEARYFSSGSLLPAVLASSSVPGVFPPVLLEGSVLVDGGITEWEGCQKAVELGATRIVLVACGGVTAVASRLESFRSILVRSMEVSNRSGFARTVMALRGLGVEVLPVFPELTVGNMLDFDHAPTLIHAGRAAARRALADWERADAERTAANVVAKGQVAGVTPLRATAS